MTDNYDYLNPKAAERAKLDKFSRINQTLAKIAIARSLHPHQQLDKAWEIIRELITDNLTLDHRLSELEKKIDG